VPLFAACGEECTGSDETLTQAVRSRPVEINPLFFGDRGFEIGMKILIAPFDDLVIANKW
jgi:hypothetical protein